MSRAVTASTMHSAIIQHRKLSDEVAERIEAMIRAGQFAAGDQLPSGRDLMKLFGVGRPTVREGLFSLQKIGLVVVGNGTRARVTRPTAATVLKSLSGAARHLLAEPNGVAHFQKARLFFEVGLVREAARDATAADIRKLEAALAANRNSLDDLVLFEKTDVAFHYVLAEIPRNPLYTGIHEALVEWLTEQRNTALRFSGANQVAYRSHKKIFEAVAGRDPDAAEEAMRGHLTQVAKMYWKVRDDERQPVHRPDADLARNRHRRGTRRAVRREG